MRSQRKTIPVVFTLHSTCAHVDMFFMKMKTFDPGFGSPKMENVSSYIMFLVFLNFQLIRKGWYTEKKKKVRSPCSFCKTWTLSLLCCCFAVFTPCWILFLIESHLFHKCAAGSLPAVWHDVILCLSRPYAASYWSPCSSNQC